MVEGAHATKIGTLAQSIALVPMASDPAWSVDPAAVEKMVAPMKNVRFYDPRHGTFAGLSNLHPRPLTFEDVVYATPEHAYQAAKARDPLVRDWLTSAPTPELAAAAGDALQPSEITAGWDDKHVALMHRSV